MSATQTRIDVLFTSVGRRVELLRAFRRAFRELGVPGRIIGTDVDPLAPAFRETDVQYLVPPYTSPDFVPTLIEICRREHASLVFPLIDPDIPILAGARADLEATGVRLAVVSAEAAAIAADKWRTTGFLRDLGLPTPRAWLPDTIEPDRIDYPVFIKPRRGSAGKHTYRVEDRRQLEFFLGYVPGPIVQEHLSGPEITSDVVADLDGRLLGVVSRRRIEVRWGEVAKGVTVRRDDVIEGCRAIATALPVVGPVNVQCMLKDGVPHFTEINARFGGGVPLAIAAGADFPRWLVAGAAGLPLDVPPIGTYTTDLYLTRYDDSSFLGADDVATIEGHRL